MKHPAFLLCLLMITALSGTPARVLAAQGPKSGSSDAAAAPAGPPDDATGASKTSGEENKEGGDKGKEGEDGKKSKKPKDVSGGRFAGDPVYVHLPLIILPILGETGPEQLVTLSITVEVTDFDTADAMHTHMPRVMDALLQTLYGGLDEGNLRSGRLVNVSKVKMRATTALQSIEGVDSIKDVLIVNVSQRLL